MKKTLGEKSIRINFSDPEDTAVHRLKIQTANMINMLEIDFHAMLSEAAKIDDKVERSETYGELEVNFIRAVSSLQEASMWATKCLTTLV